MKTINNQGSYQRPNPLSNDLFLKVMGEKGDEPQLIGFLNAVLGRSGRKPIESLEIFENKKFERDTLGGKSCVLDVLADLQDGTKVNIEVQLSNRHNMERRSLFYWCKVYLRNLKKGMDYRELPNVIAINIVDFDFLPGENFHTCFHLREDADPSVVLSSALEIHFVNMVKWRRQREKDLTDPLNRWLVWFNAKSPPELIEEVVNMDGAIMAAQKKYYGFDTQEEFEEWDYERRRQLWEMDQISRINYEKMAEIARNALAEGLTPELVSKITRLDMNEIKELMAPDTAYV